MYCTVRFTVGGLPGAVGFSDAAKAALAKELGVDKRIIRGSYAILGASRHPLIQTGAALRRLMTTIRDQYTIPEYTLAATAAGDLTPQKVKGSYLIEECRVEEFLQKFEDVRQTYVAWGAQVTTKENYNQLKHSDMVALGDDWKVIESKYPTAEKLADAISCDVPRIEPYIVNFTLADVAPETNKRFVEQAEARLNASIEGALSEIIHEFLEMVGAVARNCGKRIRLLPPVGHPLERLRNAEVQSIQRHGDNPDVPLGSIYLTVQPSMAKNDKFVQKGKSEDLMVTFEEYEQLMPYETNESKTLTQSNFDNLIYMAQKIQHVRAMLGNADGVESLTSIADQVSDTLHSLGSNAGEIAKALKNSYARSNVKKTFEDYTEKLKTLGTEVRESRGNAAVKRRIVVGKE